MKPLYGVILMGGRSKRFGFPKGLVSQSSITHSHGGQEACHRVNRIDNCYKDTTVLVDKKNNEFHDAPCNDIAQWQYLKNILLPYCSAVFFSIHTTQRFLYSDIPEESIIYDNKEFSKKDRIPLTGILSAQKQLPRADIIVIAVDLFYFGHASIKQLLGEHYSNIKANNKNFSYATVFLTERMQPLCAIYRAESFSYFLEAFKKGRYSICRIIESMAHKKIVSKYPEELRNVNTRITICSMEQIHEK